MRADWKIILMVVLIPMLSIRCSRRYFSYPTLTDEDKTELIRLTIEKVLHDKEWPFHSMLCDSGEVIVGAYLVKQEIHPNIQGINLKVLNAEEIQERADVIGPFRVMVFNLYPSHGKVIATVRAQWALPKDYETSSYYPVSAISIEFHKEAGNWLPGRISYSSDRLNYEPDALP